MELKEIQNNMMNRILELSTLMHKSISGLESFIQEQCEFFNIERRLDIELMATAKYFDTTVDYLLLPGAPCTSEHQFDEKWFKYRLEILEDAFNKKLELSDSKKDNAQLHLYIDEAYDKELISASYSKFLHWEL